MKTKYLMIAAAVALFAACSNDENVGNNGPVAVQINAEIGNVVTSRASGTTWGNTDEIGVSVVSVANNGKTTGTNVKYTKATTGFGATTPIYFQDSEEVTFRAYYPFKETSDISNGIITAKTEEQTQQSTFDFMFATGATASKNSPEVNFVDNTSSGGSDCRFKHSMSQLQFIFKAGSGVDLSKLTNYTVKSLNMNGQFDIVQGTAMANNSSVLIKDLSFSLSDVTTPYTATPIILFPQTVKDGKFKIEVTVDNQTYKAELTLPNNYSFEAGKSLTYTVTINKTELTVGNAEIKPWETQTSTGEATMQ